MTFAWRMGNSLEKGKRVYMQAHTHTLIAIHMKFYIFAYRTAGSDSKRCQKQPGVHSFCKHLLPGPLATSSDSPNTWLLRYQLAKGETGELLLKSHCALFPFSFFSVQRRNYLESLVVFLEILTSRKSKIFAHRVLIQITLYPSTYINICMYLSVYFCVYFNIVIIIYINISV